jgi:hypothetical protein
MGVYNPLLDMPVSCAECDTRGGSKCFLSRQLPYDAVLRCRHPDCPLVEVKVPHGRLIDADELPLSGYIIKDAPTVLEAED